MVALIARRWVCSASETMNVTILPISSARTWKPSTASAEASTAFLSSTIPSAARRAAAAPVFARSEASSAASCTDVAASATRSAEPVRSRVSADVRETSSACASRPAGDRLRGLGDPGGRGVDLFGRAREREGRAVDLLGAAFDLGQHARGGSTSIVLNERARSAVSSVPSTSTASVRSPLLISDGRRGELLDAADDEPRDQPGAAEPDRQVAGRRRARRSTAGPAGAAGTATATAVHRNVTSRNDAASFFCTARPPRNDRTRWRRQAPRNMEPGARASTGDADSRLFDTPGDRSYNRGSIARQTPG